ncbi:biotin--[acetyl-CoA-carboxylase] ligase [Sandaracinobacteroides sp. A072]|uniref:biotin--[acetyl-CoA-carboxylase] ligase n=1 Tax=Sandaracinobacteroides sp. A072 TaxID=3461146 RepID=UPI0040424672
MSRENAPPVLELDEVGSTNDWVRSHAADLVDGQWVTARRQTAGRGRMGRAWQMPEGNLAATCLIRPLAGEERVAELAFVAALALHDMVSRHVSADRLQLKWPNDLLLDGAKLSGILLEREAGILLLGVGVNLAAAPSLPDRATACLADAGVELAASVAARELADAFAARRAAWRLGGFAPIRADWLARAHPPGTPLWVGNGAQAIQGRFRDVAEDGALLLEAEGGFVHRIHAGDVWLSQPPAGQEGATG